MDTLGKIAAFLLLVLPAIVFADAGQFQFAAGEVKIVDAAGKVRMAAKGTAINQGDTVVTGPGAAAQVKMSDGALLAVRAETRVALEKYAYTPDGSSSDGFFVRLLEGGFRALTGLIGARNKENVRITTPDATIGIRGTDHEVVVVLPGAAGREPGTYDRVYSGGTYIATGKGRVLLGADQVGFVGRNGIPALLPELPPVFEQPTPFMEGSLGRIRSVAGAEQREGMSGAREQRALGSEMRVVANIQAGPGAGEADWGRYVEGKFDRAVLREGGSAMGSGPEGFERRPPSLGKRENDDRGVNRGGAVAATPQEGASGAVASLTGAMPAAIPSAPGGVSDVTSVSVPVVAVPGNAASALGPNVRSNRSGDFVSPLPNGNGRALGHVMPTSR